MDLIGLLLGAIGGGAAGAGTGKAVKSADLGNLGNIIAGVIGGLGGTAGLGPILGGMLGQATTGDAAAGLDLGSALTNLVGGGVGGAVLQLIVGFIKNKMMAR